MELLNVEKVNIKFFYIIPGQDFVLLASLLWSYLAIVFQFLTTSIHILQYFEDIYDTAIPSQWGGYR